MEGDIKKSQRERERKDGVNVLNHDFICIRLKFISLQKVRLLFRTTIFTVIQFILFTIDSCCAQNSLVCVFSYSPQTLPKI